MTPHAWTEQLSATVRPLVAFGAFAVFAFLAVTGKISADAVLGIVGMVLGYYFQARSQAAVAPAAPPTDPRKE